MSIEIVVMEDCASNYGVYEVPSSTPGKSYTVTFQGSEGPIHCDCTAFKYSKNKDCKHIRKVWNEACMYNPQWKEGKENPEMTTRKYTYSTFTPNPCPHCGGPMVYVRRAV